MGNTVNSNAFRYGVAKNWSISSSKLLTHNSFFFKNSKYFNYYYFIYILKNVLFEFFGSNEIKFFSIVFVDCKLHDYQSSANLNIYLYTPSLRRFYKLFCHTVRKKQQTGSSKFKNQFTTRSARFIKKKIYKTYLKKIFLFFYAKFSKNRFKQKKIFKYFRFFFKTCFKKKLNVKVFNFFFYRFFFQFLFFKIFKLLQLELTKCFKNFFPFYYSKNKCFKVNFFFIKEYWYFSSVIAYRFAFRLLARRSLASLIKPFQLIFFKKNKFLNSRKKSFLFRLSLEGIDVEGHKFFIKHKNKIKGLVLRNRRKRFFVRMLAQQKKQVQDLTQPFFYRNAQFFRGSQEFIDTSNNLFKIGGATSVFIRGLASLPSVISQNFSRMKRRTKFNFKETPFFLKKYENKKSFSSIFKGISGLKIRASGRFSKKQIAEQITYKLGSIKLSNPNSRIDFFYKQIALKNSTVGFKIWMSY